jgi:hypothetical protein
MRIQNATLFFMTSGTGNMALSALGAAAGRSVIRAQTLKKSMRRLLPVGKEKKRIDASPF